MSNSQATGIRILCMAMGWGFGVLIFGSDATWIFGMKSFLWCGIAGGGIGTLLTTK